MEDVVPGLETQEEAYEVKKYLLLGSGEQFDSSALNRRQSIIKGPDICFQKPA